MSNAATRRQLSVEQGGQAKNSQARGSVVRHLALSMLRRRKAEQRRGGWSADRRPAGRRIAAKGRDFEASQTTPTLCGHPSSPPWSSPLQPQQAARQHRVLRRSPQSETITIFAGQHPPQLPRPTERPAQNNATPTAQALKRSLDLQSGHGSLSDQQQICQRTTPARSPYGPPAAGSPGRCGMRSGSACSCACGWASPRHTRVCRPRTRATWPPRSPPWPRRLLRASAAPWSTAESTVQSRYRAVVHLYAPDDLPDTPLPPSSRPASCGSARCSTSSWRGRRWKTSTDGAPCAAAATRTGRTERYGAASALVLLPVQQVPLVAYASSVGKEGRLGRWGDCADGVALADLFQGPRARTVTAQAEKASVSRDSPVAVKDRAPS